MERCNSLKSILKVVFVIIGAVIGAGFASGQEIWLFFNQYGNLGIAGIVISCVFSGIIIYQVFRIIEKEGITSYSELLEKKCHNKICNQAISIVISLFLLISFYIMVAGMSAYFHQEFGFPTLVCSIVMSILCYLTLQRDMKGVMAVSDILIPCLILFILYLGIKNLNFSINYLNTELYMESYSWNWIFSSILYASYNSIMLIPMLVELKPYVSSKAKSKKASIITTILLSILGLCLFFLLLRGNEYIYQLELPMIEIVKNFGKVYQKLYGIVVVVAIFTTAISAGYGFLKNQVASKQLVKGNIEKRERNYYRKILLIMCALAPIVANFGFSNLVSKLYPVFGILGLVQIVILFKVRK